MNRVIWQPRRLVFWVSLLALLVGVIASVATAGLLGFAAPGGVLPALGGTLGIGLVVLVVIKLVQGRDRPPAGAQWAALLWGAAVATSMADVANGTLGSVVARIGGRAYALDWMPAWVGPTSEELAKLAGIVAVMFLARQYMRKPADGLAVGMMTGLGFQLVEDMRYVLVGASESPNSDMEGALQVLGARSAAVAGSHWLYSGLAGLGVGYLLTRHGRSAGRRWLVATGLFGMGYAAHWLWNSPLLSFENVEGEILGVVLKSGILLAVFVFAVRRANLWSWQWFADSVRGEHPQVISEAEVAAMGSRRNRRNLGRELQRAFLALARARHDSPAPEVDPTVAVRRRHIARLRPGALVEPVLTSRQAPRPQCTGFPVPGPYLGDRIWRQPPRTSEQRPVYGWPGGPGNRPGGDPGNG